MTNINYQVKARSSRTNNKKYSTKNLPGILIVNAMNFYNF